MNFLAHLVLAEATPESRLGNLMGDFCQGIDLNSLPVAVQAGIWRHRAVDRFTDTAAEVREAKALFSKARRRFAPVMIDVLFDHLLLRHWHHVEQRPYDSLCQQIYQDLWQQRALMPPLMATTVTAIVQHDWFASYQHLDQIGLALDRIASRIRFANQFAGSIDEIRLHYSALNQLFLQFYPKLQLFVQQLGPEQAALAASRHADENLRGRDI
jgi:acyl carrier protein phosphodiesterase